MSEYKETFAKSKIDGSMICEITDEVLKNFLNVDNFMHRKRILKAI